MQSSSFITDAVAGVRWGYQKCNIWKEERNNLINYSNDEINIFELDDIQLSVILKKLYS